MEKRKFEGIWKCNSPAGGVPDFQIYAAVLSGRTNPKRSFDCGRNKEAAQLGSLALSSSRSNILHTIPEALLSLSFSFSAAKNLRSLSASDCGRILKAMISPSFNAMRAGYHRVINC